MRIGEVLHSFIRTLAASEVDQLSHHDAVVLSRDGWNRAVGGTRAGFLMTGRTGIEQAMAATHIGLRAQCGGPFLLSRTGCLLRSADYGMG
jgi:hypothetical protein